MADTEIQKKTVGSHDDTGTNKILLHVWRHIAYLRLRC